MKFEGRGDVHMRQSQYDEMWELFEQLNEQGKQLVYGHLKSLNKMEFLRREQAKIIQFPMPQRLKETEDNSL